MKSSVRSLIAFVVLITAHAFYKAGLFLVVGVIDQKAGSRQLYDLEKLIRWLPLTACAAALAGMSQAGMPPFLGFFSKEMIYTALWQEQTLSTINLEEIPKNDSPLPGKAKLIKDMIQITPKRIEASLNAVSLIIDEFDHDRWVFQMEILLKEK